MTKKNFNHYKAIYVVTIISMLFTASGLHAEERVPASKALSERTKEFLSDPARTGSLLGSILVGAAVPNPLSPLLGSLAGFLIGKSSAYSNKDSNAAQRYAAINRSLIPEDGVQVAGLAGLTGKQLEQNEQIDVVGNTSIGLAIRSLSWKTGTESQSEQNDPMAIVGNTSIGLAIRSLSGATGTENQPQQTEQIVIVGSSEATGTENQPQQTEQIVIAGSSEAAETENHSNQTEPTVTLELARKTGARSNLQQQLAYACSNVQLTQPLSLGCYYHSQ
jgi:hypothetical protein